jgi:hypothetical protein
VGRIIRRRQFVGRLVRRRIQLGRWIVLGWFFWWMGRF